MLSGTYLTFNKYFINNSDDDNNDNNPTASIRVILTQDRFVLGFLRLMYTLESGCP